MNRVFPDLPFCPTTTVIFLYRFSIQSKGACRIVVLVLVFLLQKFNSPATESTPSSADAPSRRIRRRAKQRQRAEERAKRQDRKLQRRYKARQKIHPATSPELSGGFERERNERIREVSKAEFLSRSSVSHPQPAHWTQPRPPTHAVEWLHCFLEDNDNNDKAFHKQSRQNKLCMPLAGSTSLHH